MIRWAAIAIAALGSLGVAVVGLSRDDPESWVFFSASVSFLVAGAFLVRRVPRNAVSWVLLGASVSASVTVIARFGPGALADVEAVGFATLLILVAVVLPVLFPDGKVIGPGWTAVLGVGVASWVLGFAGAAIERPAIWLGSPLVGFAILLIALGALGAAASLIVRWVRGDESTRRQLTWIVLATVGLLIGLGWQSVVGDTAPVMAYLSLSIASIPAAIGVAVLRYRLYDVGRVVSRTITYALLAGLVFAGYGIGAVWLPSLLGFGDEPIWVAATTLLLALAFNPVRRRLTRRLDGTFNRTPYDSDDVLDRLGVVLRATTDPAEVERAWISATSGALQPAAISVWTPDGQPTGGFVAAS